MVSDGGKNSDCFQDHSNSRELGIKSKEDLTVIKLSETDGFSQQVELNTGTKYKRFGNLRDFYFFQDHTTSSNK